MVRIGHRWRERPRIRLGEQDREIVAAWFVVLLAVAAGFSFLNIQQYAASHCPTPLAMPRVLHRPLAATEDWENLTCSSGPCGYMLSGHERDDESDGAAEPADNPAAAASGKPQLPLDPIANTGKDQRELLCS
jgi:hypothetical protein